EEHFIFIVAACARPMIAGDSTSPAATAEDDFSSTRRLTSPVFMVLSPLGLFFKACCTSLVSARCRTASARMHNLTFWVNSMTKRKRRARALASRLLRPGNRRAVPIFAGGIFELLPAAFDHRR